MAKKRSNPLGKSIYIPSLLCPLLLASPVRAQAPAASDDEIMSSLLEILNTPVVSASKSQEKVSDAPATILVFRREELEKRGYTQLDQIFDDLPGMSIARAYGDIQMKSYWRGFRNVHGDPFLILLDGITLNSVYYNAADFQIISMPISNIERVEVVYGPASALYGANAFMGVVNVITRKTTGTSVARTTIGSNATRIIDASLGVQMGETHVQVTARMGNRLVDSETSETYEYSKSRYLADRELWGGFVDNDSIAGVYRSENIGRTLDLRASRNQTEFGLIFQDFRSGYGNEYATDKTQTIGLWHRRELSLFMRQGFKIRENLDSSFTIRYRESGLPGDSIYMDAYDGYDAANPTQRNYLANFTYYQMLNSGFEMKQDFDWKLASSFNLMFGLSYEKRDTQTNWEIPMGGYLPASTLTLENYPWPSRPSSEVDQRNHILIETKGAYLQGKWTVVPGHSLILGIRSDSHTRFDTATTLRAGYVGNLGAFGVKALFGQAYQEPTPRLLYGNYTGAGANEALEPQLSNTAEVSGSYTGSFAHYSASFWRVKNKDTIVPVLGSALNQGGSTITGVDLGVRAFLPVGSWARKWEVWGHFSHLFSYKGNNQPNPDGSPNTSGLTADGKVGDLAPNQVWLGSTLDLGYVYATLQARHMGSRTTVVSNPVGSVDSYTTVDIVLGTSFPAHVSTLQAQIKVTNLFDKLYYHPGLSDAGAGTTPGHWVGNQWFGSGSSYFNSLLAQPGREFHVTLTYQF